MENISEYEQNRRSAIGTVIVAIGATVAIYAAMGVWSAISYLCAA